MKIELNKSQNSIIELEQLNEYAYERIFKVYKDDNHYAYNILRTIHIPEKLDDAVFYYTRVNGRVSWTNLSFDFYGSIKLWWLICIVNGILNPVILPKPGTVIKVIKPEYIKDFLHQINQQI